MRRYRMLALGACVARAVSCRVPARVGAASQPSRSDRSNSTRRESWPRSTRRRSKRTATRSIETGIGLGARPVVAPAIESGPIELQPEYIGSRVVYWGGRRRAARPPIRPHSRRSPARRPDGAQLHAGDRHERVRGCARRRPTELGLTTMSDTAAVGPARLGLARDCPTNALCGAAGRSARAVRHHRRHGRRPQTLLPACDTPMAEALPAWARSTLPSCARRSPTSSSTAGSSSRII